jgi:lysophospholipase L1-like esterase
MLSESAVGFKPAKAGRYTISGGTNGTNSALTSATWRVPNTLPVSTTRWRLKWRNINSKTNTPLTGVTTPTLKGVYVGTETLDANGSGTGNFTAAPTQAIAEVVLPSDGTTYTSAWITATGSQFVANVPLLFSIAVTGTGQWGYCRTQQKFVNSAGPVASQTIGAFNGTFPMYGEWWIEYEFAGAEPVGLFIGDSLTDGVAPTSKTPQASNLVNTWALRCGIPAASQAVFGIDASDIAGFGATAHYWTRYGLGNGWVPDFAVVWLGSNDLNDLRTEAQIKADLGTIYTQLRAFGIQRIYGATILPRGLVAGQETIRTAVNTWLLDRPYQLQDVFELDRAVTLSPSATTLDDARYADADAVHFLSAGYAKLSRAVPAIQ